MRRLLLSCAALGLVISTIGATSPAQATPYHLIRWDNTGYCQIWDLGITLQPVRWPSDYEVVSKRKPTIEASLATKDRLLKKGVCKF
jgi:hypothetical protein